MFLVLYGKDSFSLRERLKALMAEMGAGDALAAGVSVFAAADVAPEEVEAACLTAPLLGGTRLVILEGLLAYLQKRATEDDEAAEPPGAEDARSRWLRLTHLAATMPPTNHLILVDGDISQKQKGGKKKRNGPKKNALLPKFIKTPGVRVELFPGIGRAALPGWIAERARRQGVDLSPAALRALAELSGGDLWSLTREIEKLGVYAGRRRIEQGDVQALVADARQGRIFALVDQVATGQQAAALRSLRRLFAEGASAPYILTMIVRQFRLLALARELLDQEVRPSDAVPQLPAPEYAGRRAVEQAGRFSMAALREAYRRLVEADLDVKRGRYGEELRLELLLGELAALSRPRGSSPRGES